MMQLFCHLHTRHSAFTMNNPSYWTLLQENNKFCTRCWKKDRKKDSPPAKVRAKATPPHNLFGNCQECSEIIEAKGKATNCSRCDRRFHYFLRRPRIRQRFSCYFCPYVFCHECDLRDCLIIYHPVVRWQVRICKRCVKYNVGYTAHLLREMNSPDFQVNNAERST